MKKYDRWDFTRLQNFWWVKNSVVGATDEKGNAMHSRDMAMKQGARVRVVRGEDSRTKQKLDILYMLEKSGANIGETNIGRIINDHTTSNSIKILYDLYVIKKGGREIAYAENKAMAKRKQKMIKEGTGGFNT